MRRRPELKKKSLTATRIKISAQWRRHSAHWACASRPAPLALLPPRFPLQQTLDRHRAEPDTMGTDWARVKLMWGVNGDWSADRCVGIRCFGVITHHDGIPLRLLEKPIANCPMGVLLRMNHIAPHVRFPDPRNAIDTYYAAPHPLLMPTTRCQ